MRFEVIRPDEITPALAARWRALQQADIVLQSPFFTPEFTRAVGRHRADLRVAVIERDGEVAGFLPFHRKRLGVGSPVGGQVCDYQGPVAAPDVALDPATLLRGAGLVAYDYNHAPRTGRLFREGAYAVSASPVIDLSDGFEAWREHRKRATGKAITQLERKRRKMERELGPLQYTHNDTDPEVWRTLLDWKSASLAAQGTRPVMRVPWVGALLETIRDWQSADFAGVLSSLRAGDRLIAVHFGMRSGGVWHWWFPTYDSTLTKHSPGLALLYDCVRWMDGYARLRRLDLGRGTQLFKQQFANAEVLLCEGSLERAATPAGALRRARKGIHRAAVSALPAPYADLQRRALNKVLRAGLV